MPSEFRKCVDCGDSYEHTEESQRFYEERQFAPPKRCLPCRDKKKQRFAEREQN